MAGDADPAIHNFLRDPRSFLTPYEDYDTPRQRCTAIDSRVIFPRPHAIPGGVPHEAYFKLVAMNISDDSRTFAIQYHGLDSENNPNVVRAYYLGYNGGAQASNTPAFIDVPKLVQENDLTNTTLLFTGELSGCSVIVTDLNENSYRIFHDSRLDSSILYDNVVMAIDYSDYATSNNSTACVFMQHRDSKWTMFVQLQTYKTIHGNTQVITRPMEPYALQTRYFNPITILPPLTEEEQKEQQKNQQEKRESFEANHKANREELRRLTSQSHPGVEIPDEPDGMFQPFEGAQVSLSNPAVRKSEAIRELIEKDSDEFSPVATGEYSLVQSVLKWMEVSFKGLVGKAYQPAFDGLGVREGASVRNTYANSRKLDYAYLWIKQKEARGFEAVVRTDNRREAPMGNTAGEVFTEQELNSLRTNNQEFATGFENYKSITIPGFENDMTPLEMMKLFDNSSGHLNQTELGALLHYIQNAQEEAFRESVWNRTNEVVDMFQNAQGATKPMPQDILLNAVPDEYGGRCYPLVRAMSVALAQSDFAVDQLGIRLIALSPEKETDMLNAALFKLCLKDLHASYPAAEASTLLGRVKLSEAISKLQTEEGKSIIFALHTETHAMLLGATNRGGTTSYHFYDPNFTLATFSSRESLLNATTEFFTDLKFADVYGADKKQSDIFFTLVRLDTDKMASIEFDYQLNVADFVGPGTLMEAIDAKATMGLHLPYPQELSQDHVLSAGTSLLEAAGLAEVWREATARLEADIGLEGHWMPILETLKDTGDGSYEVEFINLEDTKKTRRVSTRDPAIKDFKVYINERLKASDKAYKYAAETFIQKEGLSSVEAIDGLNAMFVVNTLIEHFRSRKESSQGDKKTNAHLAMALEVQSYLNLTQLGQQSLGDVFKIVELTRTVIRGGEVSESALPTLVRSFGRVSEGIGFALGAVDVGLDAYELHNAETETEKSVFGTQLAFDSASFLAASGGVGAGLLGASSAAALLGGVSVVLSGLAIGFGALASAFGQIAEDAEAVGRYFGDTEQAYKAGGYKYDQDAKILVPLVGAVISEIEANGDVRFDSQYIYRTHHGPTGSGYINYFFWIGDFPKMIRDKSKAINVRKGIKAPAGGTLANNTEYTTIILPASPKSYISYEYKALPFCTSRHDYGFDVIRELEVDGNFDYDFYIFPSEFIIRYISHEYVETPVTVKLETRPVRVQVPNLPNNMHNFLKYSLHGTGADYTLGLALGVGITLCSSSKNTRWILDSRNLGDGRIVVNDDSVSIAGVRIAIADRNFSAVLLVRTTAEVRQVDFDNHETFPVREDASKIPGGTDKLLAYLGDLKAKHLLSGRFIIVDNYTTPEGKTVGRAFYQVDKQRLVYTSDAPAELTSTVQFGADMGADGICFFNTEQSAIWRVDPTTGTCLAKFNALFPSATRTLMRVWEEDNLVHAVFRHQLRGGESGELGYVLTASTMTLVSMVGTPVLLSKLDTLNKWKAPKMQLLDDYDLDNPRNAAPRSPADALPGIIINIGFPRILSVFGKEYRGKAGRFWIRFEDQAIIKIYDPPPPPDIVLAGIITLPFSNVEEFYFYSRKEQCIISQRGTGTQTSQQTTISVPSQFGHLSNVFCANNEMFVITNRGYFLRLTSQGTFLLQGVNRKWFVQFESGGQEPWWTTLKSIADRYGATAVAVLDLHDANNVVVPVWFYNGRIVIASPPLTEQLHIAGLTENGGRAWLCHREKDGTRQLYSQPLVPDEQLANIISPTKPFVNSDKIPRCEKVLDRYPFKKIARTNNGLRYTTTDGVVLMITGDGTITVYGVDHGWQTDHLKNLELGLAELAKKWNHNEVVVMVGSKPVVSPAWYLVSAGRILTVADPSITWLDGPVWLGTDTGGTGGYFYLSASGEIHSLGVQGAVKMQATLAKRLDDLLVVIPSPRKSFCSIPLQNVRKLMLSQIHGGDSARGYIVTNHGWASYNAHMVDWRVSGRVQFEPLRRRGNEVGCFLVKKINDDLVLFDTYTTRALAIRRVFREDIPTTEVTVKFDGSAFRLHIGNSRM